MSAAGVDGIDNSNLAKYDILDPFMREKMNTTRSKSSIPEVSYFHHS